MSDAWSIRDETEQDAEAINRVITDAFAGAPHADGSEPAIVRGLRDGGALTVSLVAESDGRIVGHVAVSPVTLSDGTAGWFGLGPVAVDPGHQRLGIGSALVSGALDRIKATGAAGCVVLGDPAYYHRFEFRAEPGLVLPGFPAEYFQAVSFGGSMPEAEVAYHRAFGAA